MDRSKKMSETEAEIMEVLWNSEAPMSAAELIGHFAEQRGKVWKAPTLATFLSRLSQKGLVGSVRRGRVPYYHPIQTRAAYQQSIAQELLDTMYQVGRRIPYELRETALGGCAAAPSGCRFCH